MDVQAPENQETMDGGIGRYRHQPLDQSARRSIQWLDTSPAEAGTAESAVVRNFYHAGRFWIACIPLDAVREVYGQSFNFSRPCLRRTKDGYAIVYRADGTPKRTCPFANHVQTRFVLDAGHPVRLYEDETLLTNPPTATVHDLVYSIEAVGPKGVRFSVRDGCGGHLVCAHRMLSTEEMVFERIALEGQFVVQSAPLDLAAAEKNELLRRSLLRSDQAGMTEPYYLFGCRGTNNCTSNPFRILDQVVHYNRRQRLGAMLYRLPVSPRLYLRVRGLDADPQIRRLVREEFREFIDSADVRQRKRAFLKQRKLERKSDAKA